MFESSNGGGSNCQLTMPCWSNIYGTPDYISNSSDNTPSNDDNAIYLWTAARSMPDDPEQGCCIDGEGIMTCVNVTQGKKYLLTYTRKIAFPPTSSGITNPDFGGTNGNAAQGQQILQEPIACSEGTQVEGGSALDNFNVRLTNYSEISAWSFSDWDLYQNYQSPTDVVQYITPTETNISATGWNRVIRCFEAEQDWNTLYLFVEQNPCSGEVYALIDQVEMVEDTFDETETNINLTCEEAIDGIDLGYCIDMTDLVHQWEFSLDEGATWNILTDDTGIAITESEITVFPNITQSAVWYRLTRNFVATNPNCTYDIIDESECTAQDEIIFVVSITDDLSCCIEDINCCNDNTTFATIPDFSNTQIETWNIGSHPFGTALGTAADPIYINGDINFVAGNNISMANLHFVFGPNGRIRIGPQADLTIASCTLSGNSACETMWQGIQIFDNASGAPQNSLTTKENTIIKDAIVGIATMDLDIFDFDNAVSIVQAANIDYEAMNITVMPFMLEQLWEDTNNSLAQTGGNRIDIKSTDFVNCYQGINSTHLRKSIVSYSDGFFSIVELCNFKTEDTVFYPLNLLYPNDPKTEAGISCLNTSTLDIKDCNFDNLQYGIRAAGDFAVRLRADNFIHCDYPILGAALARMNVSKSTFEHFRIGIQSTGVGSTRIQQNLFNTQSSNLSYNSIETTAILINASLTNCDVGGDFTLDFNEVKNVRLGVVVINNDDSPTLIKNNDITNTNLAVYALENNSGADIRCNTFTNYSGAAIRLGTPNTANYIVPTGGHILADQGNCNNDPFFAQRPAANIFDANFTGTDDIRIHPTTAIPFEYFDLTPTINSISSNATLTACPLVQTFDCNTTGRLMSSSEMLSAIQFADSESQKNAQMRDILRSYAKDYQSLNRAEVETLAQLFDKVNTRAAKRQTVLMYAQVGDWEKMEEHIEHLPLNDLEDEHFYEVQKMLCALKKNDKNIREISTEQESQLLDIAQHRTKTAYIAQSLLFVAKGIEFPLVIPYEATKNESNTRQLPTTSDKIMLYPNPATDILYLNMEEESNILVTIYDISGQKRLEQSFENTKQCILSTQNLQQGSYFLHLKDEESSIVKPFVIMR